MSKPLSRSKIRMGRWHVRVEPGNLLERSTQLVFEDRDRRFSAMCLFYISIYTSSIFIHDLLARILSSRSVQNYRTAILITLLSRQIYKVIRYNQSHVLSRTRIPLIKNTEMWNVKFWSLLRNIPEHSVGEIWMQTGIYPR